MNAPAIAKERYLPTVPQEIFVVQHAQGNVSVWGRQQSPSEMENMWGVKQFRARVEVVEEITAGATP